jgi:hypothetical protein
LAWQFEQFDRVAGGVVEQDLLAAVASDNGVAEVRPRVAQGLDRASEIVNFESDAVPATRLGFAAIGHGLGGPPGAGWGVEQELEVASREPGEAGAGVEVDPEAEMLGVDAIAASTSLTM